MDIFKLKSLHTYYPEALTSYDLLKALALILTAIGIVGYYFSPYTLWPHILGMIGVPIWFFLIGFSKAREIPKSYWIFAVLIVIIELLSGGYLFPLNIIFGLILARLMVDGLAVRTLRSRDTLIGMYFLLALPSLFVLIFIQYGTLGLFFTLVGVMRRLELEGRGVSKLHFWSFALAGALTYACVMGGVMAFLPLLEFFVLLAGVFGVCFIMSRFRPHVFSVPAPKVLTYPFQLLGRRTLEMAIVFFIALRAAMMVLMPEEFIFMDFGLFQYRHLFEVFL
jgi:hypothetical protein